MATDTSQEVRLQRVVVLGANGAMGAGSAAVFASGGCDVTLVARDLGKVEGAMATVQGIAKSERIADGLSAMTYGDGMETVLAGADLIFEALAEDMELKRNILAEIDAARPPDAIVATVSSGLSIRDMTEGLSPSLKSHFAGIHLYNPPHVMTGAELIPHPDMGPAMVESLRRIMADRFGRQVIVCADMAAFAGNRIGFKVLNEVAQLAQQHGVQMMDTLVGPYTGRAMAPLATIDLVGWDVHQAIVDNVVANVQDEAIDAFKLPAYMAKQIEHGHLGDKTPLLGGFYRRVVHEGRAVEGKRSQLEVLDPKSGKYQAADAPPSIPFVEQIKDLHRRGRYREGIARFMGAEGPQADIAREVILGYVSYALNRVGKGEVVASYEDVDRIMTAGFNWAPPSALVDLIGLDRTIKGLEQYNLSVPALLTAAKKGEVKTPLFNLPFVSAGRYFSG
ncbi:MAG: 3-hydroxyacyl-CoA dehydrogenase family protein [Chloroflexi bacterium]|nr:3-hydroxyacyl-CoA dehydrogenase family protein [Chloroflexota bacterium]